MPPSHATMQTHKDNFTSLFLNNSSFLEVMSVKIGKTDDYFVNGHKFLLENAFLGLLLRMATWMKNLSKSWWIPRMTAKHFLINIERKIKTKEASKRTKAAVARDGFDLLRS
jgi:hypothetical protein